jgi:hypothetical protein
MTTTRRPGRARLRLWLRLGVVAVSLSLLSGCYTASARLHQATSPATRPWFCNAVGNGTPLGGHGNGSHVHPIYQSMTKGELSWEDCMVLAAQFDRALDAVKDVHTRAAGEAAGWRQIAQYIPGLGTHHVRWPFNPFDPSPEGFDPTKPTFLIYGGTGSDAPLVGLSYAAPGTSNPPPAFAGTNDWWHLHQKICYGQGGILAGAEEIPDEECTALGGRQVDLGAGIWLLHIWIIPPYLLRLDAFASGHPCLGETGPLPLDDPCWELANRDPSEGLPPGDEHDNDHGADHSAPGAPGG